MNYQQHVECLQGAMDLLQAQQAAGASPEVIEATKRACREAATAGRAYAKALREGKATLQDDGVRGRAVARPSDDVVGKIARGVFMALTFGAIAAFWLFFKALERHSGGHRRRR